MSTTTDGVLPSKGEINRCGLLLVSFWHGSGPAGGTIADAMPDETRAVEVLNAFRRAHAMPLQKVRMGLVSFSNTTGIHGQVTQRLKRRARIIRKIHRMPGTNLARLEDIGGCRVVANRAVDVGLLLARIRQRWGASIVRERDYASEAKDTGYRAWHLVVERDGRRIEVQLRTRGQQQWADAIEAADSRLNLNLKDGVGPEEMLTYFKISGQVIYRVENELVLPPDLLANFETARQAVIRAGYYTS